MADVADEPIVVEDVKASQDIADEAIEVEEDTTTEEPSTEENKTEAKTEDEEPSEDTDTEGEEESTEDSDTEETDDQPKERAEVRQQQLNTEIRDLVAKRNELRQEVAKINAQVYQPQTAEELMDTGMDEATARVTALEQRTQMAEYTAQVTDLNASLNTEALQVMHDFQVYDAQSSDYKPELAQLATDVYNSVAQPKTDEKTGLIYETNATPYPVFEAIAKAYQAGAQSGKVSGQKATDKMLAASDTPSSAAPKPPKQDAFATAFDAEFDKF